MKKDKSESKKKHPLRKSLCQSFLLVIALGGLSVIIDYFDENGFILGTSSFLLLLFMIGVVGSILIFMKNYTTRNYLKIFTLVSIIVVAVSGVSIFIHDSKRLEQWENSICGWDGDLYYCGSEEPITCDDGNYAVRDDDSYKCIGSDEYRHDVLGEEYDYPCIGKYEKEGTSWSTVTGLTLEEKACLEPKIEAELKEILATKKKDIESKFDIRDKVKVTAGNQGRSNTCSIWATTKALEISAQLQGLDYQFLLDFEKKINSLDVNDSCDAASNFTFCDTPSLIPGKKKFYELSDYSTYKLSNLVDKYSKILGRVYADRGWYDLYDEVNNAHEYNRQLTIIYIKELVKKNGSVFITTIQSIQPGHRMLVIGWDDSKESWLVLNSWGNTWSEDNYVPNSNGDGTTWIKYSNKNFDVGITNFGATVGLMSE